MACTMRSISCMFDFLQRYLHLVFVNSCGDWKISGLEYVCPVQQVTPNNKVKY